jgi:cell division protein FtsL
MSRARGVAVRRAPAPRHPRRVSGPAGPAPRPTPVPGRPRPTTPVTASHAMGATLRALPDHRLLDTLLRSRAWIWLLGIALGGIVFMQVSLLQMNNGIGNAVNQSTEFEHRNALLAEEVAELSSGDRVRAIADSAGLVSPDAGEVAFVTARGEVDARHAVGTMTPPSDTALAAEGTLAAVPVVEATPAPVATVVPEVTAAAPVETVAPVATVAPVVTEVPPTDYTADAATTTP